MTAHNETPERRVLRLGLEHEDHPAKVLVSRLERRPEDLEALVDDHFGTSNAGQRFLNDEVTEEELQNLMAKSLGGDSSDSSSDASSKYLPSAVSILKCHLPRSGLAPLSRIPCENKLI